MVFAAALVAGIWTLTASVDSAWGKKPTDPGGGGGGGGQSPTHTLVFLEELAPNATTAAHEASAVNNAGVIVGETNDRYAFVIDPVDTDGDGVGDLWFQDNDGDSLNDLVVVVMASASAFGVADTGQVVGLSYPSETEYVAFSVSPIDADGNGVADTWYQDSDGDGKNDLMTELPGLNAGDITVAYSVNNQGQIVGLCAPPPGDDWIAFLWDGGLPIALGTLGGLNSSAASINDVGEIVGSADDATGRSRAFFLRPADSDGDGIGDTWFVDAGDGITNALMIDLGTLGGNSASAWDVNNSSQVAGNANNGSESVPVKWEVDSAGNVTITAVAGLTGMKNGNIAYEINASGVIAGNGNSFYRPKGALMPEYHGFVSENGVATDVAQLIDISISSSRIFGLNDRMMMVGYVTVDHEWRGPTIAVPLP